MGCKIEEKNMNEKQLRKKIIELTKQYFVNYHNEKKFIPGETYINYSGRVYDEKEGESLVNSALDFWLTTGEFSKVATRMLFGGNMTKQPAYQGRMHKSVSKLENTDYVMNNSFWIGVYPGITDEMKDYIIGVFDNFFKNY